MLERGLNHRFLTHYIRKSWVICLDEKYTFVRPVKVTDIQSAFKLLLAGFLCSLILLICEIIVSYKISRFGGWPQKGRFGFIM